MSHRKTSAAVVVALLVASISACVHISSTRIGDSPAPLGEGESVEVFVTRPPTVYQEVALLRAKRFLASDNKVLEALRKRAAKLGANGLLLLSANSATQRHAGSGVIIGGKNSGGIVVGSGTTEVDAFERAVAIRWTRQETVRD